MPQIKDEFAEVIQPMPQEGSRPQEGARELRVEHSGVFSVPQTMEELEGKFPLVLLRRSRKRIMQQTLLVLRAADHGGHRAGCVLHVPRIMEEMVEGDPARAEKSAFKIGDAAVADALALEASSKGQLWTLT